MSILLLYSDFSRGVVDYTKKLHENVLACNDPLVCLPVFNQMSQDQARSSISLILNSYNYNAVHLQYDCNVFKSSDCDYENFENLAWFISHVKDKGCDVIITLHGKLGHEIDTDGNFADRWFRKILRRLFSLSLIHI